MSAATARTLLWTAAILAVLGAVIGSPAGGLLALAVAALLGGLAAIPGNRRTRVVAALVFMVGAKLANVGVPMLLKTLVDARSFKPGDPSAVLVVPMGLLLAYGLLRLSTTLFTELREFIFS